MRLPALTPRRLTVLGAVSAVLLLGLGYVVGVAVPRFGIPGDASPEAGFARDMSDHHAQAVEMGMIAFRQATLPEIRTLGGDIALTQQSQIGMMQTWLRDWGLGPNSDQRPMSWMPEGQRALNGNLMPGMATRAEIDKLRSAKGQNVDILFCQYMLRHHLGGIHMVEGLVAESSNEQVTELATTMKLNQSGEVQVLRDLLTKLGAAPLAS